MNGTTDSTVAFVPPRLIVSFPNQSPRQAGSVLVIDRAGDRPRLSWIDEKLPRRTAYGLTVMGDYIFSVASDNTDISDRRHLRGQSYLTIFDADTLQPIDTLPVPGVSDAHSICVVGDEIFVVATATDEVIRFNPLTGAGGAVFRASANRGEHNHINSIVNTGSKVLVSGFGPRTDPSWHSTGDRGFVQDIASGEIVAKGLFHPHSLMMRGGHTIILESTPNMLVRDLDDNRVLWRGASVLRGLAVIDDSLLVGLNCGRVDRRRPGYIDHIADPGELVGQAAIVRVDFTADGSALDQQLYDLNEFGAEIYDILDA